MRNRKLNNISIIIIFMMGVYCHAWALPTDKNQPIHVIANSAHLNKTTGISIFQGNVKLTQGTSILNADVLTLYTDKNSQLLKAVAQGKLATYSTLTDVNKPRFIATADTIEYLPPQSQINLIGHAKATQGPNNYTAPEIQYHIDKEMVVSPNSGQGRTTIVIQPQFFNHDKSKTS